MNPHIVPREESASGPGGTGATGATGPGRGYRLGTRALDPAYGAHKREIQAAAAELRGVREAARVEAEPPRLRPAIGPLFAGVAGQPPEVSQGFDRDEIDEIDGVDEVDEVDEAGEEGEAERGDEAAGRELPRLLTCLPGPVAIFRDRGEGDGAEPSLLAVDLRALRSHLVFQRLMRDLRAGEPLAIQRLLQPVVVRCLADEAALCVAARDELLALGVDLDAFGGDAVVVRGVPAHLRSCLDDADLSDLIARVIPWLRLRASERRASPAALMTAIAATAGARDPAPRLARRWIGELLAEGESLDAVPGISRWRAAELLGPGRGSGRGL